MASPSPSKKVKSRLPQPKRGSDGGKKMINVGTQTDPTLELFSSFRRSSATSGFSTGQSTFSRESFRTSRDPAEADCGAESFDRISTFRADAHITCAGRLAVSSLETDPSSPARFVALYMAAPAQQVTPGPLGSFLNPSGRISTTGASGRLSAQGRPSRVSNVYGVVSQPAQGPGHDRRQALVWCAERNDAPEACLASSSSVSATCLTWDQESSSTVFGGTESGGIVMWDTRAGETPVQCSQHAQAVKGTGHARRVRAVTCSSSGPVLTAGMAGELCVWNKKMMRTPQDTLRLTLPETRHKDSNEHPKSPSSGSLLTQWPLGPTEIGLAWGHDASSAETFYLGTDTGGLFKGSLPQVTSPAPSMSDVAHQMNGSSVSSLSESISERSERGCLEVAFGPRAKDDPEAHAAPISGLQVASEDSNRPESLPSGDLILTSSWDCSVRLWAASNPKQPLKVLSNWSDNCLDVQWVPRSGSKCVISTLGGGIELWDVAGKRPYVLAKTSLDSSRMGSPHMVRGANKIRFSSGGDHLFAGDTGGLCTLFHLK